MSGPPAAAASSSDVDSPSSSTSSPSSSDPGPQFSRFCSLPPELRHQIWRFAIPSPGINFFNVHCFPNDHDGCNLSTSPPWSYLDLRRLDIEHSDDEVSTYDPSAWQARHAIRQTCREARIVCAVPDSKSATIILTRPKRGLYVRAGDGQLRNYTRSYRDYQRLHDLADILPWTDNRVYRKITIHTDDILALSVENCSFNLPHEETPAISSDDETDGVTTTDIEDGWSFDPQLTPQLPSNIPSHRLCAAMTRCNKAVLHNTTDSLFGLLYSHIPGYNDLLPGQLWSGRLLLMFDAHNQALGERDLEELTPTPEVVQDRWGDSYARLPWKTGQADEPDGFPIMYRLTKIWPETNDIRERYLRSAILRSPKRPVGCS
ncbi:hypothetical protein GGR57DRAFT_181359 [Xylariaceae sp. FL1272]|nr:hypothetical protein GGR57DRAFT_181359 [Xylariaceae sp. FL1272]